MGAVPMATTSALRGCIDFGTKVEVLEPAPVRGVTKRCCTSRKRGEKRPARHSMGVVLARTTPVLLPPFCPFKDSGMQGDLTQLNRSVPGINCKLTHSAAAIRHLFPISSGSLGEGGAEFPEFH